MCVSTVDTHSKLLNVFEGGEQIRAYDLSADGKFPGILLVIVVRGAQTKDAKNEKKMGKFFLVGCCCVKVCSCHVLRVCVWCVRYVVSIVCRSWDDVRWRTIRTKEKNVPVTSKKKTTHMDITLKEKRNKKLLKNKRSNIIENMMSKQVRRRCSIPYRTTTAKNVFQIHEGKTGNRQ